LARSDTHVVTALRRKRAEVSGHIADLERKITRQRVNLAHIDATIRLFSPDTDPNAIPPKRTYRRTRYFAKGELAPISSPRRFVSIFCHDCRPKCADRRTGDRGMGSVDVLRNKAEEYLEKARAISDRQRARLLLVQAHNYLKCAEETEAQQLSARR